ncbi:TPA: Eco57I restriction-modification methylase domain-containing protein [Clostridioides difficile]|uniref:Eco57I restriction-modification methylase domain-containing protein n=1 Tax=Clostridioides difficile TaxID=1496 RepID=UPI00038CF3F5|nr:Eco57I restriction-modification methylase domain-containing protein [Clostridioides difficile]AYD20163.1 hypothetical protein DA434_02535 [Clostridioides difficile]EGT3902368.1 hypothetical protein [Clostridioides difficile]EGT3943525.1 hypothetical protein [Clostridioides difficile]EGT4098874.1 hypothetical protein [Clostridioides difficile]EKS6784470.1 Eco57I restriction-modification methylase domain-containing protein [Clostridioides difficile]
MIEIINENTKLYQKNTKKIDRKKKGQFFTPLNISKYMASMSSNRNKDIRILDCGAGTGILGLALVEELLKDSLVEKIEIDFYENDDNVISVLNRDIESMSKLVKESNKTVKFNVLDKNFILSNTDIWNDKSFEGIYDIVISNPPYKKLSKQSDESKVVLDIVYGQPNIYSIFMAMSIHLLKDDGEMIFITPRSFTSGAYFKKFREYMLENTGISSIHIFNSRSDVFDGEEVLQEAIITRAVKNQIFENINIISTNDGNFDNKEILSIPYNTVVNTECENKFILIPSTKEEVKVLNTMKKWDNNLITLGFKLKTGPVVDFRATEYLINKYSEENTVPLLWSDNFIDNEVKLLNNDDNFRYIINNDKSKSLLLENKDYLLIKRFTAKEEIRRIQVAIYDVCKFNQYNKIGIENHVNYIAKTKGNITKDELFGLFCLFNSTIIDKYYRIVNGNTQVNATEVNAIPLPNIDIIKRMGQELIKANVLNTEKCDEIISRFNNL